MLRFLCWLMKLIMYMIILRMIELKRKVRMVLLKVML